MSADEHTGEPDLRRDVDGLREQLAALRLDVEALADRAEASTRRADASDARELIARHRADVSENRQDIAEDRADASEARELRATSRVDAIQALVSTGQLRIDDLEEHVDIDRQLILELNDTGVLAHDEAEQLHTALRSSRVIGQAVGIVMARAFVTQDQAFALLQQASTNTDRRLQDIAAEVVLTGEADALM